MRLTIPEHHKKVFAKIGALSDEQVEELRSLLATVDPLKSGNNGAEHIAGFDPNELKTVIDTLSALYAVRARTEIPLSDFLKDIGEALRASGDSGIANEDRIVKILESLLNLPSFTTSSKAESLRREHRHIFHDAKIITDLRPVFDAPKEAPVGFVIAYTLKIAFHDGPRHDVMYLALDGEDLLKIKAAVDRAEEKANSLRALLSNNTLTSFG